MRAKPILVLGGACLLGLAAVHLTAESTTATPTTDVAPPAAPHAPAAVHAAAAPEVRSLATLPTPARVDPPPAAQADGPARDLAMLSRIEQDLGARLRAERIDPSWAPATEHAIERTIASPRFSGLRVESLACGATMCRLGIVAGDQVTNVESTVEELTSTEPFRNGGFVRFTGERALTMFVARDGHPLPPAPRG